jgi:HD-like signal output (HDOD) protein/ActR/RegA family two-component response regulator
MKSILFVDDDQNLLNGLRRMLYRRKSEWDMNFVGGGKEALKLFQNRSFDLVVTDMRMPEVDGAMLLAEVKKCCPESIRIVLSGQANETAILRAIEHTHQYVQKPCNPASLGLMLSRLFKAQDDLKPSGLSYIFETDQELLPLIPNVYFLLVQELCSETPNIEKIVELAYANPPLAVKMLQLAHCAFLGGGVEITSIQDAISRIGIDLLRDITQKTNVFKPQTDPELVAHMIELSSESVKNAQESRTKYAYEGLSKSIQEKIYTQALLSNLGRFILLNNFKQQYINCMTESKQTQADLEQLEIEVFGISNKILSNYYLTLWGLPAEICNKTLYAQ